MSIKKDDWVVVLEDVSIYEVGDVAKVTKVGYSDVFRENIITVHEAGILEGQVKKISQQKPDDSYFDVGTEVKVLDSYNPREGQTAKVVGYDSEDECYILDKELDSGLGDSAPIDKSYYHVSVVEKVNKEKPFSEWKEGDIVECIEVSNYVDMPEQLGEKFEVTKVDDYSLYLKDAKNGDRGRVPQRFKWISSKIDCEFKVGEWVKYKDKVAKVFDIIIYDGKPYVITEKPLSSYRLYGRYAVIADRLEKIEPPPAAPDGYEHMYEYRLPEIGEWNLNVNGRAYKASASNTEAWIVKRIPAIPSNEPDLQTAINDREKMAEELEKFKKAAESKEKELGKVIEEWKHLAKIRQTEISENIDEIETLQQTIDEQNVQIARMENEAKGAQRAVTYHKKEVSALQASRDTFKQAADDYLADRATLRLEIAELKSKLNKSLLKRLFG